MSPVARKIAVAVGGTAVVLMLLIFRPSGGRKSGDEDHPAPPGRTRTSAADREQLHTVPLDLARLKIIAGIEDSFDRRQAMFPFLANLAPGDFEAAANHLMALGLPDTSDEMQLLVSAWCTVDVHAAAAFSLSRGAPELLVAVCEDWQARDYAAALEWSLSIPPGDELREFALSQLIAPMAVRDPARAMADAIRGAESILSDEVAQGAIKRGMREERLTWITAAGVLRAHPGQMAEILAQLPEGSVRDKAAALFARSISQSGPLNRTSSFKTGSYVSSIQDIPSIDPNDLAAVTKWTVAHPGPPEVAAMKPEMFCNYAVSDPDAAAALASGMPEGKTREAALAGAAAALALRDGPQAGLAFIEGRSGGDRDLFLTTWAAGLFRQRNVTAKQPSMILENIDLFTEGDARNQVLRNAFEGLRWHDKPAAEAWAKQHPEYAEVIKGIE